MKGEMMGEFTLNLSSPITDEEWDIITDVDFDNTTNIVFSTKNGKEVQFTKVVPTHNNMTKKIQFTCRDLRLVGSTDYVNTYLASKSKWFKESIKLYGFISLNEVLSKLSFYSEISIANMPYGFDDEVVITYDKELGIGEIVAKKLYSDFSSMNRSFLEMEGK